MRKLTLTNRLSFMIMAILIVMSVMIMSIIYVITKDSMAREVESRYESVILHSNEKIRGVLSDVYVAAINNLEKASGEDGGAEHVYVELQTDIRARLLPSKGA